MAFGRLTPVRASRIKTKPARQVKLPLCHHLTCRKPTPNSFEGLCKSFRQDLGAGAESW
jgi:hypothetical protein